jgi:hypothetical protein
MLESTTKSSKAFGNFIVGARVVVPESYAVNGVLCHELVFAVIGGRTPELKVIRQRLDEAGVDVSPVRFHACDIKARF